MSTQSKIFRREEISVNGVKVVMLTAGKGEPLMFWHGGGTFHGFDFAAPWAERYKVIIPYHPGFGESGDDPSITGIHDYVLHYADLIDQLSLDKINLVGFSLGGFIAAAFATQHAHRLRKLVLVAPAGLYSKEHPMTDLFRIRGEQLPSYLVENMEILKPHLPTGPDVDFMVGGYREMTSVARVFWERGYDRKLAKWLHRVSVPTLMVWGEKDRLIPVEQAAAWAALIPRSSVKTFKGAGHLVLDEKPEAVRAVAEFLA
jgi:pimeloyl-ACP methyl ester carboxylesterase